MFKNIISWYFSKRALPYWCILALDCAIVAFSVLLSTYILDGGSVIAGNFWRSCAGAVCVSLLFTIFFRVFHTYSGVVRYSSFIDLWRIGASCLCGSALYFIVVLASRLAGFPDRLVVFKSFTAVFLTFGFSLVLMCAVRVLVKTLFDLVRASDNLEAAFVYGVRAGAVGIAKAVRNSDPMRFVLKGFIAPEGDWDVDWLMGLKVYRDDDTLLANIDSGHIRAVIVSPLQAVHFSQRENLVNGLIHRGIRIQVVGDTEDWDGKSDFRAEQLRPVRIEDLLPREAIEVDMASIGALLRDRVVMITGAAGSIGSEMVRQVAAHAPAKMVLIDQAETPMHTLRLMMKSRYPSVACDTVVTSITNAQRMEALFSTSRPDYVFHAAAYKHVPMMEDNPFEAVQNNVRGTRVIADLAVRYGTKKFVMISTDKAVNPTNVMGCSKRICEIYCQSLNQAIVAGKVKGVTQFVTTRFGNVLGSNGSVIPIFREQIARGGPVTVTHPDIIRYFMLIPEACKLVLEAGTMGKGGEIFVFDMGKPVKIVDLARRMIKLSGAKNVDIVYTGLRDGEKLYEEVLSDKENTLPTIHPKIMVARVREYDYEKVCADEDELLNISLSFDDMAVVRKMKAIVPEFRSQVSKYQVLDV